MTYNTSAAAKSVFSGGDQSKKGQMGCEMARGGPKMARVGQKDRHKGGKGRGEAVKTPAGEKSEIFMK